MISQVRFSGLASGLDTENIIKNLMSAERMPLNKMLQQKQWQEWQQEAYREANNKLLDLRSSMEKLRLSGSFNQSKVSSSNTSAVDVSRVGNPSLENYTITVNKLAEPAQPASVKFNKINIENSNMELKEEFSFKLSNGEKNKDGSIKEDTIKVLKTDTINTVISKINAQSNKTGVTAFLSEGDEGKRIVLTSTESGKDSNIIVSDIDYTGEQGENPLGIVDGKMTIPFEGEPSHNFNLEEGLGGSVNSGNAGSAGIITINGMTIETKTNTFTYDGMRINLKSASDGPITINKQTDTDAIFNDIKGFVDKYNEVIESLNGKLSEKKYRDFPPLLAEQKEDMKEKEIELWEEKAKSGLLRSDPLISNVLTSMRTSLYTSVSVMGEDGEVEKKLSLSQFGITTSDDYFENGKLVLDENKLKEAITNNLDDVKAFFAQSSKEDGTTLNNRKKHEESGIGYRIYNQLNESMKELTAKAGSTSKVDNSVLGKSIGRINDQISDFERRLSLVESRYWKQFTAMEKAIQQANSQSGWLMQQFGGM
ncbi:hypothetical protein BEP19_07550 [Ammoniphilus oxalaticus]|uniref:Flagellar hook-associated protein 2 n=1 Tax=Ammoniphilus oxalaticus TaxID=66863 RepID=A0A419SJW5_9BACL|nr:flagellar hook-associated protein 2 [Ammoniphilus oxalaticus]RKD24250.1 hypothetical protein BEP19_07550 [Ammoniphilus oxalaticus]